MVTKITMPRGYELLFLPNGNHVIREAKTGGTFWPSASAANPTGYDYVIMPGGSTVVRHKDDNTVASCIKFEDLNAEEQKDIMRKRWRNG